MNKLLLSLFVFGCFFTTHASSVEAIENPPIDLFVCDDNDDGLAIFDLTQNDVIVLGTQNPADFTITYHETLVDAETDVLPIGVPSNYLSIDANTLFVRVEANSNGSFEVGAFDLFVNQVSFVTPTALEACDTEGALVGTNMDGITMFDLSSLDAEITAGDTSLVITYYETQADLDAGIFIDPANAYINSTPSLQTLFIQISSTTAGMCTAQSSVDLIVNPLPVPIQPALYELCDDIESSSDIDEFSTFDLRSRDDEITGGNPDLVASYHLTQNHANAGSPTLLDMYQNVIPASQTVWVRVENAATGCYDLITLTLAVVPLPSPSIIAPVEECDEDFDGIAIFDLTDMAVTDGIFNGETNFDLSFHETLAFAEAGTPAIATPDAFASPSATIYARATDNDTATLTACFRIITLDLIVNPLPSPAVPADVERCDPDNDGIFEFFILSDVDAEITAGDTSLTVVYYLTEDDANNAPVGLELDDMMYINIDPFFQTVYARVFNAAGCFGVVPLNLVILNTPLPNVTPDDYEVCDDNGDGLEVFDLSSQESQILDGLDPTIFSIVWYVDQTAVDANVPIPDPSIYISNTNTVIAVVTDIAQSTTTFCSRQVQLELIVTPLPALSQNTPFNYSFCEEFDGNDTQGEIDLTTLADDAGFLDAPQNTADFVITYHNTAIAAENGAFPIDQSGLFTVTDGDALFFRIENATAGCFSLGSVIFTVESQPQINPVENLIQCASNPGINGFPNQNESTFDLTQQNDVITGGEPSTSVVYYTSLEDAQNMNNEIANPTDFVNSINPQTIYAGVLNTFSFCSSITTFDLIVSPLPFTSLEETCIDIGASIVLDGNVENPIAGASYAYIWTLDDVLVSLEPTVTIDQQGLYQVTITVTYDNGQGVITVCNYVASTIVLECPDDTDDDGVSDEDEDLNGNGNLDDDDTDDDGIPNYLDDDDDGDSVMTIDEITGIGAGFAPQDFIDTDDDMIENYLDDDDDGDNVLTIDEDYNDSGSPLDDDINMNDIPDFLDPEVALSTDEFMVANFTIYPNPVIDQLSIKATAPFTTVTVYDITGKVVQQIEQTSQLEQTLYVSELKMGLYFIRIDTQETLYKLLKR